MIHIHAWRKDIGAFATWFSEKGKQVTPSQLTAFGIPIDSRYGKASELRWMLAFAEEAALNGVAGYITSVFYNSKAGCCTYKLSDTAYRQPAVLNTIIKCAIKTLPSFEDHEGNWRPDEDDSIQQTPKVRQ